MTLRQELSDLTSHLHSGRQLLTFFMDFHIQAGTLRHVKYGRSLYSQAITLDAKLVVTCYPHAQARTYELVNLPATARCEGCRKAVEKFANSTSQDLRKRKDSSEENDCELGESEPDNETT
ncbi:hypothetical protein M0804_013873 [Polistes exclamans]|nr:hypothetical protein M0804_013873 [Polistes exclamans]